MAPKQLVAALAPMLIVAMFAAVRPAAASRPSSDAGGVQDAAPLNSLRRLSEVMHPEDLEHESVRHRMLTQTNCPSGYKPCNGKCVNFMRDADNCGACGNVCPNLHQCTSGVCTKVTTNGPTVATGSSTTTKCYTPAKANTPRTACYYDTKYSNNNCGVCGIRCPIGSFCWNGKCICLAPNCLCDVSARTIAPATFTGSSLQCIPPGQTCPSTGKVCCPAGQIPCATGCCWPCSDPNGGVCQTQAGNVCCPTQFPGTRCYGPPGGRQCCPVGYWTGSTTRKCCDKAAGEKPTQCEAAPGDKSPPIVCCSDDLPCKYNANPGPNGKPLGYICTAAECPPIFKCTEFTSALTDPPCCCKKCKAPYVPVCPADANGNLAQGCNEPGGSGCGCKCPANLAIGNFCCSTKVCGGKTCCPRADDVCYTSLKDGKPACCPKGKWDSVNNFCCRGALCPTSAGNVCCLYGTSCQTVPGDKNDVCCTAAQWTGPTTNTCCPAEKTPVQCEAKAGDNNPPKICCDPDIPCQYNQNTDPSTGKVFGYSCITSACPPPETIDPFCVAATTEITNPACCCTQCSNGFVPECVTPKTACDENGTCGCKCVSQKVCTTAAGSKCCTNADDVCVTSSTGQPACCPKARFVDGLCCPRTPATCPNNGGTKCCPLGQECHQLPIGSSLVRVCCPAGQWVDKPSPLCCTEKVCPTLYGNRCCGSLGDGVKCQTGGDYSACCTDDSWTGNTCCTGDSPIAALCPDNAKICCPVNSVCYTNGLNKNACCEEARFDPVTKKCCPDDRWTGTECCPETQKECNGQCIPRGVCCIDEDCPCNVPTGPAIAATCNDPPCCVQHLCCDVDGTRTCIAPDDSNCAYCGNQCAEGETCAGNQCAPLQR